MLVSRGEYTEHAFERSRARRHARQNACEKNKDGVERIGIAKHMVSLECCKRQCLHTCGCVAIDYYGPGSMWCNLFSEACSNPTKNAAQGGSYRLSEGRG